VVRVALRKKRLVFANRCQAARRKGVHGIAMKKLSIQNIGRPDLRATIAGYGRNLVNLVNESGGSDTRVTYPCMSDPNALLVCSTNEDDWRPRWRCRALFCTIYAQEKPNKAERDVRLA
jgi:hypothetical protein